MSDFDLAIVGGGINGAGIARDAAGRGLHVLLVEQNDLASGTSSASTKLIHGGLRYLEHGWLRLVREALIEREVLLRMAPHLIKPMRFVLPVEPGMRPRWMLRLGLFVYDHLGGRKRLPPTSTLDLARDPLGMPLKGRYEHGFEYSDCWVDDARLVVLNAVDAAARGAVIRTRTRCVRVERGADWKLVLEVRGRRDVMSARVLVNATGPWVGTFGETVVRRPPSANVRLIAGSHIVVPRLFEHDRGYIFQAPDRRVVFAMPFEHDFTMIGTTDRDFAGDLGKIAASAEEIGYLCKVATDHFRTPVFPADVVWSFAGVRPLHGEDADTPRDKPQDTPRDYVLELDRVADEAPLLTVYGGKITTYRRLAEEAFGKLVPIFGARPDWTEGTALPGGDFDVDGIERLIAGLRLSYPFLTGIHAQRLVRAYGTRVRDILGSARSFDDLGPSLGSDLTAAEVRYLMTREFAQTPDDVLWRRTKLGLRVSREDRARLSSFMTGALGNAAITSG
ncbi:MAG: glycerol-3-phosphate dehydrogenase [Rhizobiales bacterium]|nr:glycerol-3-phosphate dehydrogenase [Hyphomicrobiales bacterium]